jgi:hypothetical protein
VGESEDLLFDFASGGLFVYQEKGVTGIGSWRSVGNQSGGQAGGNQVTIKVGSREDTYRWSVEGMYLRLSRVGPGGSLGSVEQLVFLRASQPEVSYYVGGPGQAGGIVFHDKGTYSDGWRYLEVAPVSTEWEAKTWGGSGTLVGGLSTALGTGGQNTVRIVARYGSSDPDLRKGDYAARLCADLSFGGYDDWYLPSKDELDLLYANLHRRGLGGFAESYYWSSSESDASKAWDQDFDDGFQSASRKRDYGKVRAVRAF